MGDTEESRDDRNREQENAEREHDVRRELDERAHEREERDEADAQREMDTAQTVGTLAGIEQKQRLRVTLSDDTVIEGRVAQSDYTPESRLRVELSPGVAERGRYQLRAAFDGGEWTPVELRYGGTENIDGWRTLGQVRAVTPLEVTVYPDDGEP